MLHLGNSTDYCNALDITRSFLFIILFRSRLLRSFLLSSFRMVCLSRPHVLFLRMLSTIIHRC